MRKSLIFLFLILWFPSVNKVFAETPLKRVSLIPQWIPQASFAGYMVALEKGFYLEAGIDLTLHEGGPDKSSFAQVSAGKATFCSGWLAYAIAQRVSGLRVVNLAQIGDIKVVSTPARHYSGRFLIDKDLTFWCSWTLIGRENRIFFSGDTGMFPDFTEIGKRYGPFDVTFMKIGAYGEDWPDIHINPEEAVNAHQELRGKLIVPIHWGTFDLGYHSWYEPADRFVESSAAAKIRIVTPRIGELIRAADHQNFLWWKGVK